MTVTRAMCAIQNYTHVSDRPNFFLFLFLFCGTHTRTIAIVECTRYYDECAIYITRVVLIIMTTMTLGGQIGESLV